MITIARCARSFFIGFYASFHEEERERERERERGREGKRFAHVDKYNNLYRSFFYSQKLSALRSYREIAGVQELNINSHLPMRGKYHGR